MAGMHIAASGKHAGQLVPCRAATPATCGLKDTEHHADEAAYAKHLAENNNTFNAPVSKERMAVLEAKAQRETEVQLEKMMKRYAKDRAGFLQAMDQVYARAYKTLIDAKVEQDNPGVNAKPGTFYDGVVNATANAMNEGFKQAQRRQLQESFSRSVKTVLGQYWDDHQPRSGD